MSVKAKSSFPSTRYIGNKSKIISWIWDCIKDFDFHTVLDAFGGTGCFSYRAKEHGKEVTYNDILAFNFNVGLALIENSKIQVSEEEFNDCLLLKKDFPYENFIEKTFRGIYFTNKEDKWLDLVVQNIHSIDDVYKKSLLIAALGQACLIKRPFNLFHRKNLYLRFGNVKRTFYNKKCWDTPFQFYFKRFVKEYNTAIFSNKKKNSAINLDVFKLPVDFDLVYLDPPYMSEKHRVNYRGMYHFLEGIVHYYSWDDQIDYSKKTRKLKPHEKVNVWQRKGEIKTLLGDLISKFSRSIVVLSYRSDGYPSIEEIVTLFKEYKGKKPAVHSVPYKYALSEKLVSEALFVAD